MESAKGTDLPELLERLGYSVRRVGRRYHTTSSSQSPLKSVPEEEKPPFALPMANQDQRRVFAYLKKRGISAQVIRGFIDSGRLYEDAEHHNCVFVGREAGGKAVFASKRGTCDLDGSGFKGDVPGSNKDVSFRLRAEYAEKGYEVSIRVPAQGKDWNELLQHRVFGKEVSALNSKQLPLKKEEMEPVADLGKLISDKAPADARWREQRQAEREAAASLRDADVTEIVSDLELFARYLDMQGDNPSYSAGNIAMVMKQNPEATIIFTRDRWKSQGRYVLETEQDKGSRIFVKSSTGRGYILAEAFDVAQTQGREVWQPRLEDDTPEMEAALAALLNCSPVQVTAREGLEARAYYNYQSMTLDVDPGCSDSEVFGAIAAEIAHARFHNRGFNREYSREGCELSAQSVSWGPCASPAKQIAWGKEKQDLLIKVKP